MLGIAGSVIGAPMRAVTRTISPQKAARSAVDAATSATAVGIQVGALAATAGAAGTGFAAGLVKGSVTVLPKAVALVPQAASLVAPPNPARETAAAARALLDANSRRHQRRVWTGNGRAHIEVRGLDGGRRRSLAEGVPRALGRLRGVNWARVNAVTGQVLVAFDERRVGVDTLLNTVQGVEKAHGAEEDDFSWARPTHPGDGAAIAAVTTELAADCAAVAAATVQAVFRFSPLPRHVRSLLAVVEIERGLRRRLKRRLGPVETDLVLTLATAAANGLTQGISTPAVDAVCRTLQLSEVWSRRQVWRRREPELAQCVPDTPPQRPERPVPRPKGPIEQWNDRLGPIGPGVAATVLALTRDFGRASDAFLAAVPKAARYGREGFATAVGRDLARRGVVPLNAAAFRRLDRVSAVVVDSDVLTTADGEPDSLADALLEAASATGATVRLAGDPPGEDLLSRVDQVLDAEKSTAEHVRDLQAEGHGVLVISSTDGDALAAADVGVALPGADAAPCWAADLVCRDDLEDVWRVLRAQAAARSVSENAVRLARSGSALGALLALVGNRRRRRLVQFAPVQLAGLVALVQGTATGLRVTRSGAPQRVIRVRWYELDSMEVYRRLQQARPEPDEQQRSPRAAVLGPAAPAVALLRRQFGEVAGLAGAIREELRDPLTPVLAVGAMASAIVGSGTDGVLVAAVLTGNALISAVQRVRAERALRELLFGQEIVARRLAVTDLDNLASAEVTAVSAKTLVPGDVIELRASDLVPADTRLLEAVDLEVDESTLTGESVPVVKNTEPTPGAPVAERTGMVFKGTSILAGSAYGVVVAAGPATEAGRAARVGGQAPRLAGVQARLHDVTRIAMPVTALGGAAVTGLGLLRGMPLRDAVAAGVSVAVAAVPEGLPLVATVAQAGGARRLSRQGTLVRTSRTLEALGRVDVVCFDKTGTLTEGRLRLARYASVTGEVDADTDVARQLLATAGRASPDVAADEIASVPHATDRAVLDAAVDAGDVHQEGWRLASELPFESRRGYSAALGNAGNGALLAVKGAPEAVLPLCGEDPAATDTAERLAADGLRVLAVAERLNGLPEHADNIEPLVTDLNLLGFVGIADVARPDAGDAVRELSEAGVKIVMITGDHPVTARAIAHATGIADGEVLTGAELQGMTESERVRRVDECTVFARVSPEHKVQIVNALQRAGHVVAMIGDGINDAAAIRLADVGIGVGADRSTSARSAADLVLPDADIRRVHHALLEGRALWHRVRDAVSILVGGNAGEVGFMVLGTALGGRAPITMRQMLLVNMLTDMAPALAVAVAPSRNGVANGAPTGSLLGSQLARTVAARGAGTALGATLAWTSGRYTGLPRRASTMGLAALITTQLGQTLVAGRHSPLVVGTSLASFLALVALVQLPVVNRMVGCSRLGPVAWGVVLASAAVGTFAAIKATPAAPTSSEVDEPPADAEPRDASSVAEADESSVAEADEGSSAVEAGEVAAAEPS